MSTKRILVALAGNPNVGKTTILNHIAGTSLKVGNWPGVTVEKKEAVIKYRGYDIHFVDLPGIYTLEAISDDERIAVRFLEKEDPDVIVNVIETPNFERNLNLTIELLEFEKPTLLLLNMMDEARKQGMELNIGRLEEVLGVKVIETVGRTGEGVKKIIPAVVELYERKKKPSPLIYSENVEKVLHRLSNILASEKPTKHRLVKELLSNRRFEDLRKSLKSLEGKEPFEVIDGERTSLVKGLTKEVVKAQEGLTLSLTDRIDRIVLHPFSGFIIMIGVIYLTFKLSFDLSSPFVDWIDGFMSGFLGPWVQWLILNAGLPQILGRFFSEALIGGVGFVLTFVPLIGALYFFITLLEMSGYIPRVAFMMDRFMHRIGLHGRSVIPLIMGFGCNVPAIIATRTIDSYRDKMLVIAMIPFMSCPARLVVYAFFISIFFREKGALILTFLYLLGILVAIATAFLLRKTAFRGRMSHFIMEIPPYRFPSLRTLLFITWAHVKDFLYRAGTLIFGASVLIWALLNLPPGVKNPSESFAGYIGRAIVPVFEPIGLGDWRATTSLIPAFLAREIVISSMGTIYKASEGITGGEAEDFVFSEELKEQVYMLGGAFKDAVLSLATISVKSLEVEEEGEERTLKNLIKEDFSAASALSFMVFILIYTSCLGTFAVMMRELGKKRAFAFLGYSFITAWLLSFLVYRIALLV